MLPATSKNCRVANGSQSGFTLIEALIAAVILAIGVVGIVGLLTMSKVYQHESIQRVRAVELASGILERIRRNPEKVAEYGVGGLLSPLGNASRSLGSDDPKCDVLGSCDAAELAAYDLWSWERLLDGSSATVIDEGGAAINTVGLENVRACINFTADFDMENENENKNKNSGIVDVVIQWQGIKETSDAVAGGGVTCGDAGDADLSRRQVIVSSYIRGEQGIVP